MSVPAADVQKLAQKYADEPHHFRCAVRQSRRDHTACDCFKSTTATYQLADAYLAAEQERARLADDMTFIAEAAESWHRDDAAKGRALAVIADRSRAALSPEEDTTHNT